MFNRRQFIGAGLATLLGARAVMAAEPEPLEDLPQTMRDKGFRLETEALSPGAARQTLWIPAIGRGKVVTRGTRESRNWNGGYFVSTQQEDDTFHLHTEDGRIYSFRIDEQWPGSGTMRYSRSDKPGEDEVLLYETEHVFRANLAHHEKGRERRGEKTFPGKISYDQETGLLRITRGDGVLKHEESPDLPEGLGVRTLLDRYIQVAHKGQGNFRHTRTESVKVSEGIITAKFERRPRNYDSRSLLIWPGHKEMDGRDPLKFYSHLGEYNSSMFRGDSVGELVRRLTA